MDAITEEEIYSYWVGTETYEAFKIYMDLNFDRLRDSVTAILGRGRCRINSRKFQNDIISFESKDDVFTLLVHLGYLSYCEEKQKIAIPNLEIEEEFRNIVEEETAEASAVSGEECRENL